jgi:choline kinase
VKVILLAAGVGRRFGQRTKECPKCLIPIGPRGDNLLSRYLASFRSLGLRDIQIVVGHEKEKIIHECSKKGFGLTIRFIENADYKQGSILSLFKASRELNDHCLIMDADVFFPAKALKRLVRSKHKSAFLIDSRAHSSGEEMMVMAQKNRVVRIAKKTDPSLEILGEAVGFLKIGKNDAAILRKILSNFIRHGKTAVEYEDSYNTLMQKRKIGIEKIHEFWTEMDFEEDLKKIRSRIHRERVIL